MNRDHEPPSCVSYHEIGYKITAVIDATFGYHSASIPFDVALVMDKLTKLFEFVPWVEIIWLVCFVLEWFSFHWPQVVVLKALNAVANSIGFVISFGVTLCAYTALGALKSSLREGGTSTIAEVDVGFEILVLQTACLLIGAVMALMRCFNTTEGHRHDVWAEKPLYYTSE